MLSYAQNGEDVVLARAFKNQSSGFYVDVGACDPQACSVTKHFYDRGWHGINVEPIDVYHEKLNLERPRDINLKLAVASRASRAEFVAYEGALGISGLREMLNHQAIGTTEFASKGTTYEVEVATLSQIVTQHVSTCVDFLKIDVEGAEKAVLEGADWKTFRPRVIVIEAIRPMSNEPTWPEWEDLLTAAGYSFALFDGLNRFYYRCEEPELRAPLSVPANVLDGYVSAAHYDLHVRFEKLADAFHALHNRVAELEGR